MKLHQDRQRWIQLILPSYDTSLADPNVNIRELPEPFTFLEKFEIVQLDSGTAICPGREGQACGLSFNYFIMFILLETHVAQ